MEKKEKIKLGILLVLFILFIVLGVYTYHYVSFLTCKSKCSIKMEERVEMRRDDKMDEYQELSPADAKIELEKNSDSILLDVRTKEEYQEGHISGSKLLPLAELEEKSEEVLAQKQASIYVYCRSGSRSKQACEILVALGYQNVFNLGGIKDWPYEIEK